MVRTDRVAITGFGQVKASLSKARIGEGAKLYPVKAGNAVSVCEKGNHLVLGKAVDILYPGADGAARYVGCTGDGEHGGCIRCGCFRNVEVQVLKSSEVFHGIAYRIDVQGVVSRSAPITTVQTGIGKIGAVEVDGVIAGAAGAGVAP